MPRELQVGVKVFLQNNAGHYLVLRRSPERYPEIPNQWDVPGGRISAGTPLPENLARELREETGLEIDGGLRLIAAQDILDIPERHVVRLTFMGRGSGTPKLDAEHSEFKWLDAQELTELEGLNPYAVKVLPQLVE